jgi:hypothetical protein
MVNPHAAVSRVPQHSELMSGLIEPGHTSSSTALSPLLNTSPDGQAASIPTPYRYCGKTTNTKCFAVALAQALFAVKLDEPAEPCCWARLLRFIGTFLFN